MKKKNVFSSKILNFISYSKFNEDLFLLYLLYDVNNGFYIDIGTDSNYNYSITKAFYLIGWYGLKIDFLKKKKFFTNYRNRDINLQIIDGKKNNNNILFYRGIYTIINATHSNKTEIMKKIFNNYIPKHEEIDFCKIEEEGEEKNILLGMDFNYCRPKIFCIRTRNMNNHNSWENFLLTKGYSLIYKYKINRFYIDIRIKRLRERFIEAKKIFDNKS
jgi:hypothetical protein